MYICCVYTLQIHASMYTRNVHRLHLQNTYAKPVCLCMTDTYMCVCIHYNYINYIHIITIIYMYVLSCTILRSRACHGMYKSADKGASLSAAHESKILKVQMCVCVSSE